MKLYIWLTRRCFVEISAVSARSRNLRLVHHSYHWIFCNASFTTVRLASYLYKSHCIMMLLLLHIRYSWRSILSLFAVLVAAICSRGELQDAQLVYRTYVRFCGKGIVWFAIIQACLDADCEEYAVSFKLLFFAACLLWQYSLLCAYSNFVTNKTSCAMHDSTLNTRFTNVPVASYWQCRPLLQTSALWWRPSCFRVQEQHHLYFKVRLTRLFCASVTMMGYCSLK